LGDRVINPIHSLSSLDRPKQQHKVLSHWSV
jgi:hypothetical protein